MLVLLHPSYIFHYSFILPLRLIFLVNIITIIYVLPQAVFRAEISPLSRLLVILFGAVLTAVAVATVDVFVLVVITFSSLLLCPGAN